jgi:leucyl-tRNA synthetase
VPVQVNGKLRGRLTVPADISEERLRGLAVADSQVARHLDGRTIRKIVIAGTGPTRLVSIVVAAGTESAGAEAARPAEAAGEKPR